MATLITGVSKIATATPAAFCNAAVKGSLALNYNQQRRPAVAQKVSVFKGIQEATLNLSGCYGIAKTDLVKWFPTTAGLQVAAFPDFFVECVDGTKWTITACQPGAAKVSLGADLQSIVEWDLTLRGIATEASAGASATAPYTSLGHFNRNAVATTIATATRGLVSFDLNNGLDCKGIILGDTAGTAGHMTEPEGYDVQLSADGVTITLGTEQTWDATWNADTNTPFSVVIALTNGTSGENQTYTATNFVVNSKDIPFETTDGRTVYAHTLGIDTGNLFGRIALT